MGQLCLAAGLGFGAVARPCSRLPLRMPPWKLVCHASSAAACCPSGCAHTTAGKVTCLASGGQAGERMAAVPEHMYRPAAVQLGVARRSLDFFL